jgi:hypothetical protein
MEICKKKNKKYIDLGKRKERVIVCSVNNKYISFKYDSI